MEPYRKHTVAVTPEIAKAQAAVSQADQQLKAQQDWAKNARLEAETRYGKKDPRYKAALDYIAAGEKEANSQHTAATSAQNEVLRDFREQRRAADAVEVKRLDPKPLTDQQRSDFNTAVGNVFQQTIKDKTDPLLPNSPLRYEDKDAQARSIKDMTAIAAHLKEYNPNIEPEELAKLVTTMTAHIGDGGPQDPNAKKWSQNGALGAKGSRFQVVNKDLLQRPVVEVREPDGTKTMLHVPEEVMKSIQRLKTQSYRFEADKAEKANKKKTDDAAAAKAAAEVAPKGNPYMPDTLGQTLETIDRTQNQEKAKLEQQRGPMTEQLKRDPQPPPGMTNAQAREWVLSQQRKAQAEADKRRTEGTE